MAENEIPYALRLPAELYETVRRLAEQDSRSINRQIAVLLAEAIEARRKQGEK